MIMMFLWSTIIATFVGLASAAVIPRDSGYEVYKKGQVLSTNRFANYAAAVTCPINSLTMWNCGANCNAIKNFMISAKGGDGTATPQWFTGFDSSLNAIVVVHQGYDGQDLFTALANANDSLTPLDPTLFPNITSDIQVFGPYAQMHSQIAPVVYTAVSDLIKLYPQAEIMTIGFSTGGAIALLDALFFSMNGVPNRVKTVNYGMSRVGNQAFAGLVDAYLPENVRRIVNKRDPFPVVPALSLGYSHVAGEVHIQQDGKWISCYGDDNGDPRCIAGTVTSMQDASFNDHFGPYANVTALACSG